MLHGLLAVAMLTAMAASAALADPRNDGKTDAGTFEAFLEELWPDAEAKGITRRTFDLAFAGLSPDPRVIAATGRQPEYGKAVGVYVNSVASKSRVEAGIRQGKRWSPTLAAIEKSYGAERGIVLAIWGIETSYGEDKDRWDVIRSLATLAQTRYREPYFRNELLVALKLLQDGYIPRGKMVGSWAGAMGQPQFMPSNYFDYAVDFSGSGRPDIWTNVPDVLASIANYLRKDGWIPGLTWGFEVFVPKEFDYRRSRASFRDWAGLGLLRADHSALPSFGDGVLFFPSGSPGPAFLVTQNFNVIKRYNDSDVYALAVGHLADRVNGLGPIRTAWPSEDPQLSRDQRISLQKKLAALGYPVRDFEGHIDFDLRDAIRSEQLKFGLRPDGHPTSDLLKWLGAADGEQH
jgi:membrane-bound lytic murein transglycosylase B